MKRNIEYTFRVRELMARAGMRNSRDLVQPLRDRGITLSESQIYRLASQNPERIAFQVFAALCDIFEVSPNELLTVDAASMRTERRSIASGADVPLLDAYRPVRARVVHDDDDD